MNNDNERPEPEIDLAFDREWLHLIGVIGNAMVRPTSELSDEERAWKKSLTPQPITLEVGSTDGRVERVTGYAYGPPPASRASRRNATFQSLERDVPFSSNPRRCDECQHVHDCVRVTEPGERSDFPDGKWMCRWCVNSDYENDPQRVKES